MPSERHPAARRWLPIGQAAPLALTLAVFFIIGGAPAPHVNETHYLTKAKHYWDAAYCPGDYFLESADAHLVFYWTVGWLTWFCSLPAVAWIGRIAAWVMLAVGWLRLTRSVSLPPWLAPLSAAIWLIALYRFNFAGEWVVGGVEAKCFAYGFILFGLADVAAGRWKTPWLWFGLAAAMHVLVGAWAVLGGVAVWLTESRNTRPKAMSLAPWLFVGGALALPGLLPALALERGASPTAAQEAAQIYVFDRLPHHLAPLSLQPAERNVRLGRLAVTAAAFLSLWAIARRRAASASEPGWPGEPLDRMLRFAMFSLGCTAVGLAIEAALVQHLDAAARVLRYYWFRQSDVMLPLAASLALCTLASLPLGKMKWPRAVTAALAAWCTVELSRMAIDRYQDATPPGATKMDDVAAWQGACGWIAAHSPPDARVLVPRSGQSFKWYASRADVANWKDIPQDAAGVVEWRRRCEDVFPKVDRFGQERILDSPEQLGVDRVRALARKYGATYAVARAYPPLDLPIVFPTAPAVGDSYVVYRITEPAPAERP